MCHLKCCCKSHEIFFLFSHAILAALTFHFNCPRQNFKLLNLIIFLLIFFLSFLPSNFQLNFNFYYFYIKKNKKKSKKDSGKFRACDRLKISVQMRGKIFGQKIFYNLMKKKELFVKNTFTNVSGNGQRSRWDSRDMYVRHY